MPEITLSRQAARRFILGRQGLWPGRRWRGKWGAERAMRAMEYLQLDPLQPAARSHDLALHARVADYRIGLWEDLTYRDRKFFDWGGWLAVRPIEELPHWRVVMRRERDDPYLRRALGRAHNGTVEEIRGLVLARGTVSNRDFAMKTRRRVESYRGRKDSALALYYLWRVGELMTHHRDRFERVYTRAEEVAPAHLLRESSEAEADAFLLKKTIAFHGLHRLDGSGRGDIGNPILSRVLKRPVRPAEVTRWRERMLAEGEIIAVRVEGYAGPLHALADDAKDLRDLSAGRIPARWRPCDSTTMEEITFLTPLDVVTARERARALFDFDYKWEVYTPLSQRRFGYYTLPILWGDALVARIDPKLDRESGTLVISGFWLEDNRTSNNDAFLAALAKGTARLMRLLGATKLDVRAVGQRSVRRSLASADGG
jgi:uncharacterized protein YcaQ